MLGGMETPLELKRKFVQLWPHLNERTKRIVAAEEALRLGYGGVSLVSRACGLSRVTITKAMGELGAGPLAGGRVRRSGAGRRKLVVRDPDLPHALSGVGRAFDARRSGVATALDVQKHARVGDRAFPSKPSVEPREGRATSSGYGLQPSGKPEDGGRQ